MQKKIIVLFFVPTIKTIIYYSLFQIMMVVNSTHDKISYDTTGRGNRENPQQAVFYYITEIRHAKIAYQF